MTEIKQNGGIGSTNSQTVNIYNTPNPVKSPSIIAKLIRTLSETKKESSGNGFQINDDFIPFDIDEKLDKNKVIKYYELITNYSDYMLLVENAYTSVADVKPNVKEIILNTINRVYKEKVGELLRQNSIDPKDSDAIFNIIQNNSDSIIDEVVKEVGEICMKDADANTLHIEEIINHSQFIVFHAFVECKILEKP